METKWGYSYVDPRSGDTYTAASVKELAHRAKSRGVFIAGWIQSGRSKI